MSGRNAKKIGKTDKNVCSTDNINERLQITRRKLPHWTLKGSTYFVTFRTVLRQAGMPVLLSVEEQKLVLKQILNGNGKFYTLIAVVVMPEHVHMLLIPIEGYELSRIMKGIKGTTARKLNLKRGTIGSIWEDEAFDRIIRDQYELDEKLNYMLYNPVKRHLVKNPWEYYGWYFNEAYFAIKNGSKIIQN